MVSLRSNFGQTGTLLVGYTAIFDEVDNSRFGPLAILKAHIKLIMRNSLRLEKLLLIKAASYLSNGPAIVGAYLLPDSLR